MARDIIKVRKVGDTLVVTLTQATLSQVPFKEGDRILIEAVPPKRIVISREEEPTGNTRRVELELKVLESKKAAFESEMNFVIAQNNHNMPVEPGMGEDDLVDLRLKQLVYERDKVDVEIAQKRLELFDLQG